MPLLEVILTTFAPHTCLSCQAEGSMLCTSCQPLVASPMTPQCYRCLELTQSGPICPNCQPLVPLTNIWVGTSYTGLNKDLIHRLKFERAQASIKPIVQILAQRTPNFSHSTVIVPVPTATKRVRQRGYDQARLLARQLAGRKRVQMRRLLKRTGQVRQVGANRQQRLAQLQNAFYVPTKLIARVPRQVVLVDDILTTGASLESAARVLLQVGVQRVDAVVFAQKV